MSNRFNPWSPAHRPVGPSGPLRHVYRPAPEEAPAFIKPVRWPLVALVAALVVGAFVAIVAASSRSATPAGVSATIAEAEARDEKAGVRSGPSTTQVSLEDERAIAAALGPAITSAAAACSAVKPTEPMQLRVTMAPSGVVRGVSLAAGPLAGTAAGGCVASRLVGVKVPDYQGGEATVTEMVQPKLWPRALRSSQAWSRRDCLRRPFLHHDSRTGLACAPGSGPERRLASLQGWVVRRARGLNDRGRADSSEAREPSPSLTRKRRRRGRGMRTKGPALPFAQGSGPELVLAAGARLGGAGALCSTLGAGGERH